jgi:hypothetical protein
MMDFADIGSFADSGFGEVYDVQIYEIYDMRYLYVMGYAVEE